MAGKYQNKKQRVFIRKYGSLSIIAGFIVFLSYKYYHDGKLEESLEKHEKITQGTITHYVKQSGSSGGTFYYEFNLNGKRYEGGYGDCMIRRKGAQELFIDKSFPVIYDSTDPSNNFMLIKLSDFEKHHYSFPDSLSWVIPYSEN